MTGPTVTTRRRQPVIVYVLPFVHLCSCVYIELADVETGWEQMIKLDFPFSFVLVALMWRWDRPLVWFGILGTLWWYFLSWGAWRLFGNRQRRESAAS